MCYHTQGRVIELIFFSKETDFFRHIHYQMVQLPDTAWLYILLMMKWIFFDYDFCFKICCSSRKYMPRTSRTDASFPLEMSYNTSPVLPPFLLDAFKVSPISHTPHVQIWIMFITIQEEMLSESILDRPSHLPNVEDWHAAFGACGLRDCFLFCVRWSEAALGLGFRGFVRLLKMFLFTFPAAAF